MRRAEGRHDLPSRTGPGPGTWPTRDRRVDAPLVAADVESVLGEAPAEAPLANGALP